MGESWRAAKLPPDELQKNFVEITPPLKPEEAPVESNRCLFCYDAPCMHACPTHINIPSFIKKIATGNLKGSARVIMESNFLGATCSRVCPVDELCEGACVYEPFGKSIAIGRLQRYATDAMIANNWRLFEPSAPTGKRIACVGGGPASLSCAAELAKLGHKVTIFEKRELAGGLDTYGIVVFREPQEISLKEVEMVRDLGVEIRTGVEVGEDVTPHDLLNNYDAIFLGVGLGRVPSLGIPGEDLEGVYDALDFVESTRTRSIKEIEVGRRVAIIGAGNTAVDAATISKRLGAEQVLILYRRGQEEMTAYDFEYEFAKNEGIEYRFFTSPVRILGNHRVDAIECVRTQLGNPDPSGRRVSVPISGSEFTIPVDMVVRATGQHKYLQLLDNLGVKHDKGRVIIESETGRTSNPKIFAGGDCVLTPNAMAATVIAVEHGKIAARGIHQLLARAG
ncbi:NAD(P)-dependent oxidoreductase [Candidatus Acetothermia bacterium]|nr:NAD(P)-dependent oxidoreductase [Candidatus Acetothermia bacterium]